MSYLGTQNPPAYLPYREDPVGDSLLTYLSYFLLLNTMVPISLVVSMEVVKLCQLYFISRDMCMTRSVAKTSSINEELGQIETVFTDKTGTLTCNIMRFQRFALADQLYLFQDTSQEDNKLS